MTTEHDPRSRIVLSWLREDAHEDAERVLLRALDEVDATPQRQPWWPAWRTNRMNWLFKAAATLAAVFVIAAVGYAVLPGLAILGPGASPSSNATLIARGTFQTQRDWGAVELIATGEGANATGQMTVSREGWSLSVEFDCARTTEDGLILIGGHVTDHSNAEANVDSRPDGTLAGIALKPGSPTQAQIWVGSLVNWPATQATDCSAYVDAWLGWYRTFPDQDIWLDPIEGTVEFGP